MNTFCSYFNAQTCHSCTRITEDYSQQIKSKEETLLKVLNLPREVLLPSVISHPLAFRNKAKLVVTGTMESPIIGLQGEEDLDLGREILECGVHHPAINKILPLIKDFIPEVRLEPYRIKDKKGELKGLIIFYSQRSGEMYLRFVLRSKESLDRIRKHLPTLMQAAPELKCISANIQPVPHALLEGEEEIFFTERTYINHQLEQLKLKTAPRAFVQTNQMIAEKLYAEAAEWIKDLKAEKFVELYSGQGTFSFFAAPYFKQGKGFEINPEAVKLANQNARELGYSHLTFECADAQEPGSALKEFAPDIVLVNPPRRGLGKSVDYFKEGDFPYLIYSSCSHESLAEDLRKLEGKYRIENAQIYDMFPHTDHFETLVLLKRV